MGRIRCFRVPHGAVGPAKRRSEGDLLALEYSADVLLGDGVVVRTGKLEHRLAEDARGASVVEALVRAVDVPVATVPIDEREQRRRQFRHSRRIDGVDAWRDRLVGRCGRTWHTFLHSLTS